MCLRYIGSGEALGNRKNRHEGRPGPKPATARHIINQQNDNNNNIIYTNMPSSEYMMYLIRIGNHIPIIWYINRLNPIRVYFNIRDTRSRSLLQTIIILIIMLFI